MTDAIGLAGPVVPVDALDVTTARASQQWVTEAGEGSIAALSVGDALEYVILDDASGRLVCVRNGVYDNVPISAVTGSKKSVDVDKHYNVERLRPMYKRFSGQPLFIMTSTL